MASNRTFKHRSVLWKFKQNLRGCQASTINYLIKEIGTLCKLRSEGMLSPVYPEISSEGLRRNKRTKRSANHSRHVNSTGTQR